ncbi:hypothetical protein [Desertivirga brevis]|uniref:hypothetical protein n=1 Tax=Desertivirga brevis TaxID=2810310 RepID=UPI001A9597A2|nr:hypothetical protein [Pedobacter sp. SYSU D00873]
MARFFHLFSVLFGILFLLACRKEDNFYYGQGNPLVFSNDTIKFDTVFTSIVSTTQRVKIINPSKKDIIISNIRLGGGEESPYQVNINGIAVTSLDKFKIKGRDSANVFVRLNISPSQKTAPFLISDSISFTTDGKMQSIHLQAFGQNVRLIRAATISSSITWDRKLPYVVYDSVKVLEGVTLTIEGGSRVYFHKGARLSVAGTLIIDGNSDDSVTLASDRREKLYSEVPGQWDGIYFERSSSKNLIEHTTLKNALIGLNVIEGAGDLAPRLTLANSIVKNMEISGIIGHNTSITAFNNLIINCGKNLIHCSNGGNYNFKQNTFANYYSYGIRSTPSLFFNDYRLNGPGKITNLTLINNIIWGNQTEELIIEEKGQQFTRVIRSNLIKSRDRNFETTNILNLDPEFRDINRNNFNLRNTSNAANKGENLSTDPYFETWLRRDQQSKERLFPSDLGCYEIF